MNISETAAVLAKVKIGDNREVDSRGLVLTEWHDNIGDLVFEDAIAGVTMHRKESTDYLTFAHVRMNARRAKEARERIARRSPDAAAIEQRNKALGVGPIVFDRDQFEAETRAAIEATRKSKPNPVGPIDEEGF